VSRALTVVRLAKTCEIVLTRLGLTINQYRALSLISAEASSSLQEMATRLAIKPPNLTILLDGLTQSELVVRQRNAIDRRRMELALTPEGEELLAEADRQCEQALTVVAGLIPKGDRLLRGLDEWAPALDQATTLLDEA
jgi:DNA-binding MarR family transcriptional regulator